MTLETVRTVSQNIRVADLIITAFVLLIRELVGTSNAVFFMALLILLITLNYSDNQE